MFDYSYKLCIDLRLIDQDDIRVRDHRCDNICSIDSRSMDSLMRSTKMHVNTFERFKITS